MFYRFVFEDVAEADSNTTRLSLSVARPGESLAQSARMPRGSLAILLGAVLVTPPRTARYDQRSGITHAARRSCTC
jgi:hypothetical protein